MEAVYLTDCGCVEENEDFVWDGSTWLEEYGNRVSKGH
jgi:hypothetical protein